MSTIVVRRRHDLGLAEAKRLAENIAKKLRNDYGGSFIWQGDDLHFQRTGASGSVAVRKGNFQVRVELGFLLSALHSQIEEEIVTFCDAHLAGDRAATPGEPARGAPRPQAPEVVLSATRPAAVAEARMEGGELAAASPSLS